MQLAPRADFIAMSSTNNPAIFLPISPPKDSPTSLVALIIFCFSLFFSFPIKEIVDVVTEGEGEGESGMEVSG